MYLYLHRPSVHRSLLISPLATTVSPLPHPKNISSL